jgi:membrane protease subunit HflC
VKRPVLILATVLAALLFYLSVYTVSETNQAILVQFGRPVGGVVTVPGLHLKVPLIQVVHRFDKRWLEFDGDANEIPTKDKKYIWVDTYARWRIQDRCSTGPCARARRAKSARRHRRRRDASAVASYDFIEPVRSSNREFQLTEELAGIGSAEAMTTITTGRQKIASQILEKAAKITPEFGIELVDVRFKRINYVETVQEKVFERMISERKRIAERSRSEGQGRAAEIRGQKERDILAATSVGYKTAQELMGAADAKAALIYARAYGKDVDFYQFLKAMETLNSSLDSKATLILSTDSELFKYLKGDTGR